MAEYSIVRAHAMLTKFLKPQVLEGLAVARSINDLLTLLLPTEYGKYIERGKEVTVVTIKRVFEKVFEERITKVLEDAPANVKKFIDAYLSKFDIENLLNIIKFKKAEIPPSEFLSEISRFYFLKLDLEKLVNAPNVDAIFKSLAGTDYEIPNDVLELYSKYDSILPIEFYFRKQYYTILFERIKKIPREDRERIMKFLKQDAEIENIFTVVSGTLYNYTPEIITPFIIPYYSKLSHNIFLQVTKTKNKKQIINLLSPYRKIVSLLLDRKDALAKVNKFRILREYIEKDLVNMFIEISYLFYFVFLAEIELRDLYFVAIATQYNVPPEEKLAYLISYTQ
ncbi:MAG: V-type ATPase subunit [Candidatus Asgardarchaeia archaeon]